MGLGALFHGYVLRRWVVDKLGGRHNWFTAPGAELICIPPHSNASGVIPVAEAMLGKGVAIGTMLASMMSIAAVPSSGEDGRLIGVIPIHHIKCKRMRGKSE